MTSRYTIVSQLSNHEGRNVYLIEEDGILKILKSYGQGRYSDLIEIDTLTRLRHPNLVPITGIREEKGVISVTMPYIEGSFKRYVHEATVQQRIALFYKIASTVDFLLDQNILPFDIHRGNIVMKGEEPVIIDAGLYKRIDCRTEILDATYSSTAWPTMYWILPVENYRGSQLYGEHSISWGLGILFLYIMTSFDPVYSTEDIEKLEIKAEGNMNVSMKATQHWIERYLYRDSQRKHSFKVLLDEKTDKDDLITDLGSKMLDFDIKERYLVKDILRHPLFVGQPTPSNGKSISSSLTTYPNSSKDALTIVRYMYDILRKIHSYRRSISSEDIKALDLPIGALLGTVYIYQKSTFITDNTVRMQCAFIITSTFYSVNYHDIAEVSFGYRGSQDRKRIDSLILTIVKNLEGIIHPITDRIESMKSLFPDLKLDDCRDLTLNSFAESIIATG